ncbi:MAG: NAD(P)/FAD-dependent oxidoreductase [Thermodesulfobacteriota bacterium]
MTDYDTIIIGAGNGGLTAALTLAQAGLKTLLLERHNIPGGCATSFIRGRFEFEVALHQLSGLGTKEAPGGLRRMFENFGISDKLEFVQMENLYRYVIPKGSQIGELDVTLQADSAQMIKSLQEKFPKEASGIKKFIELLDNYAQQWLSVSVMGDPEACKEKYPLFFQYYLKSTQSVFEQFFNDPKLMGALGVYASYVGVPPDDLAFNDYAILMWVYANYKPWHVKGGSQAISNALLDAYLKAGGEVKFNCGAKKIQVLNNKVTGVVTEDGKEFSSNFVVSNASTLTTYNDMIDPEHVPESKMKELGSRNVGISATILFIGFDCEPGEMDIHETTNFITTSPQGLMDYSKTKSLTPPEGILFSCYDVDDPDFSPKGACQGALLCVSYAEPWLNIPAAQYHETKQQYAQHLLNLLYRAFPKCKDHIEEIEVSTPLTLMRYLGHPGGAIYGFERFAKDDDMFLDKNSPVDGLYHVGAWAAEGGFQPTYQSGNEAGQTILKSFKYKGE